MKTFEEAAAEVFNLHGGGNGEALSDEEVHQLQHEYMEHIKNSFVNEPAAKFACTVLHNLLLQNQTLYFAAHMLYINGLSAGISIGIRMERQELRDDYNSSGGTS